MLPLLYKGGESAEIYKQRCGQSDNGRVKTWLPYRSNSGAHLLHDVTQERLLGDQADKYYVSWYQVQPELSNFNFNQILFLYGNDND